MVLEIRYQMNPSRPKRYISSKYPSYGETFLRTHRNSLLSTNEKCSVIIELSARVLTWVRTFGKKLDYLSLGSFLRKEIFLLLRHWTALVGFEFIYV